MNSYAYHTLRVGMAITFLWIGLLILKFPEAWGGYVQPWAVGLLPVPVAQAMLTTAVFDLIIGFFLLIDTKVWIVALLASIHLVIVLVVSGITDVTARDIGLLSGTLALLADSYPKMWPRKK